jgi:LemA protein
MDPEWIASRRGPRHDRNQLGAPMSALVITLIVVGAVVLAGLIVIGWAVGAYNALVTLRNRFKNSFSQIDVQLKRRYDLIPNLVEVAKGYLKHERETLEAVMAARAGAVTAHAKASADPTDAQAMRSLTAAEGTLGGALGRLLAVSEAYPDLKANQTMASLSEELTSTENKISFARQAYNDAVMAYNTQREVFPSSLIANTFNFQPAQPYEIENAAQREAPKVAFT